MSFLVARSSLWAESHIPISGYNRARVNQKELVSVADIYATQVRGRKAWRAKRGGGCASRSYEHYSAKSR
jgi:hypothetical protein